MESFELDLNTGELTLHFSKTVNASSFVIDTVIIQDNVRESSYMYMLSTGVVSGDDSPDLTLYIDREDLNAIKYDRNVATDVTNRAISVTAETVHDMSLIPNYIVPVSINASNFTADDIPPVLESCTVNVDASALVLYFNETVETDSLNFTAITLQSVTNSTKNFSGIDYYRLTTASSPSEDGVFIVVEITEEDLNVVKQMLFLLRDQNSSYISIDSYLVVDMNDNMVIEIAPTSALQASMYTNDSSLPYLETSPLTWTMG